MNHSNFIAALFLTRAVRLSYFFLSPSQGIFRSLRSPLLL